MATEPIRKPSSLPPYPQEFVRYPVRLSLFHNAGITMIVQAIETLNDKNGSNKSSISKYIESQYGDLPAGHSALLSLHLNKMKDAGEIVFWKNNYTIADPNAPPRRGRGRPPKDPDAPPKPPKAKAPSGSGRPRGRPRKMARPSGGLGGPTTMAATTTTSSVTSGRPRGRGRPPKVKASDPMTEVTVEEH